MSTILNARPPHQAKDPRILSYMSMRRGIGYLAILLPVLTSVGYMLFGAQQVTILDSISEYYYTIMRDVFVGTLCMVALFLISYKGYDDWEDRLFNFAAVLCVLIAIFSMDPQSGKDTDLNPGQWCYCLYTIVMDHHCDSISHFNILFNNKVMLLHRPSFGLVHTVSAGILFTLLGYVSYVLFTRTPAHRGYKPDEKPTPLTAKKLYRNKVYKACGIAIWSSLGVYVVHLVVSHFYPKFCVVVFLWDHQILFFVEWICLWAFGLSWLVKGEGVFFLNDQNDPAHH